MCLEICKGCARLVPGSLLTWSSAAPPHQRAYPSSRVRFRHFQAENSGDCCNDLLHGSLLHTKREILTKANPKPLGDDFISPVFDRDGGQRATVAVLSLLGLLSAVPLILLGGGQRHKVAVLGLLVFAVPPILTFMYISPIVHPIRQREAM
jgi:hypothetical protein